MKIWRYFLKGGELITQPDNTGFILGLVGFIILLIVVIVLAMSFDLKGKVGEHRVWIGGCAGTKYGCCPDGNTARLDPNGTNCVETVLIGGCVKSPKGCCPDGITERVEGVECPKM